MVHGAAGIIFTALGFYIISLLNIRGITSTINSTIFETIASFTLSISVSSLWELYEYLSDLLFKTNLMYFDLADTMSDLLLGTAGSIVSVVIFYFARKNYRIG